MNKNSKQTLFAIFLFIALVIFLFRGYFLLGHTFIPTDMLKYYPPIGKFDYDAESRGVQNSLTTDIVNYVYPNDLIFSHWIKQGQIPFWNPYMLCGSPEHGTSHVGMLYPPKMLIYYILEYPHSYMIYTALHLLFCGITMFFFLRYLGLIYSACLLGGLIWMLNGVSATFVPYGYNIVSLAFFPLIIHLFYKGLRENNIQFAILAGMISGISFLGGYPPALIWQVIIIAVICFVFKFKKMSEFKTVISSFLLLSLFSVLISLPQLFYLIQALLLSERGDISSGYQIASGEKILGFICHLFFPRALGGPIDDFSILQNKLIYFQEFQFVGIIAIVFSLIAIFHKNGHQGLKYSLLIAALINILINKTPISNFIFQLPLLSSLAGLKMVMFTFSMCVLAAMGMNAAIEAKMSLKRMGIILLTCTIVLLFLSLGSSAIGSGGRFSKFLNLSRPHIYFTLLALFVNGIALILIRSRIKELAIVLAVLIDLTAFFTSYVKTYPLDSIRSKLVQSRITRTSFVYKTKFWGFHLEPALVAEGNMICSSSVPIRVRKTWEFLLVCNAQTNRLVHSSELSVDVKELEKQKLVGVSACWLEDINGSVYQVKYLDALPILYVADLVERTGDYTPGNTAKSLATASGLKKAVIHAGSFANTSMGGKIEIVSFTPTRIVCNVESQDNCFLVFLDTYFPGWECRVNSSKTEIIRTNYAFKGVNIPAGKSHVEFVFIPTALPLILLVSILTLIAGLSYIMYVAYINKK